MKDLGILILRVFISVFMIYGHGFPKLQKLLSGSEIKFSDPLGIGSGFSFGLTVFAELFCSVLLLFGLFPRLSTIALIITMFVAAFIHHAADPFLAKEKALMYLVVYVSLIIFGPGKYSLNKFLPSKFQKY